MSDVRETKPLKKSIWEFILSSGGILGILSLLGAEITQGAVYAILGSGVVIAISLHVIGFFKKIDINIRSIKEIIENETSKNEKREIRD